VQGDHCTEPSLLLVFPDETIFPCSLKKPVLTRINRDEVHRTGRERKRPSFFQDFENEEQNLDKILDEFEQQQMEEASNPRPKQVTPQSQNFFYS
jgi:hypothetical protein